MRIVIDTISSARHAWRYERLRRAQWRDSGGAEDADHSGGTGGTRRRGAVSSVAGSSVAGSSVAGSSVAGARGVTGGRLATLLIVWGLPLAPFAFAAATVALGRDELRVGAAASVALVLALAATRGRPRVLSFDLLRHRSRPGWVAGRVLSLLPWMTWAGVAIAAALWAIAPELRLSWGGIVLLAAAGCVPAMTVVRAVSVRVGRYASRRSAGAGVGRLAVAAALALAFAYRDDPWPVRDEIVAFVFLVFVVMGAVEFVRAGIGASTRRVAAATVWAAVVCAPVLLERVDVRENAALLGVALAILVVGVLVAHAVSALRAASAMQIEDTRAYDDTPAAAPITEASRSFTLDRSAGGVGLWGARVRYLRREFMPAWRPDTPWWRRAFAYLGPRPLAWAIVFRGAILLGVAVYVSSDAVAVPLAVAAAFLSSRLGSVDATGLEERLWMMGVDYRAQVVHGLRCLLWFGVVPSIVVGLATLAVSAWTGMADATGTAELSVSAALTAVMAPAPQLAIAVYVAALLVRVGVPGFWPLRETHRVRLAFLWAGLLGLSLVPGMRWTVEQALTLAVWGGPVALAALLVRLLRLRRLDPGVN